MYDPDKDFLWIAGDSLFTMRLIIEGAIHVYEVDTDELSKMSWASKKCSPLIALDTIGKALYLLQKLIYDLQKLQTQLSLD